MENQLKILLSQLGLQNTVFYSKDGKFNGFLSDIQKRLDDIKPDAYYIYNNKPLILFFDLSVDSDAEKENEVHKKVWSFDISPVIFIIKNKEIKVYNALNYDKTERSLEEIELSKNERNEKFSFWELQSGYTWKWLQEEFFNNRSKRKHRKRVNERLFQNIKDVREYLTNKRNKNCLSDNNANSLILRLIFIRYLIDRGIGIDERFISGNNTNDKRKSFSSLIKDPKKLEELFAKLNDNFNGVLFKDLGINLSETQANYLANVFKGEVQEENSLFKGYYFEIFDFSIIPVEVISGIYESLIDEETKELDSAVYTPSFLVEYILNDTVDKYLENNNSSDCPIIEVAVGSGIFLVQSLRKMIEKEIELNGKKDKIKFSNRIREIAKNNLFGVDINREALKVSCFSIYIALLDYQEPKDVEKYPFPNLLDENLFEANFFDTDHIFNDVIHNVKPKFILGNPPWKNGGKDKIHTKYLKSNNLIGVVSDYQLAQSFIFRIKDFSNHQPTCSLVVTSKAFYNNNASKFRKKFFSEFSLNKFLDLSPVRRDIFEKAINPSAIILFKYANEIRTLENEVNYYSIKKNIFLKHFNMLVFEKQDVKTIKQSCFINNSFMLKVATYGNTLDFKFIKKLLKNENLGNFFEKTSIESGKGLFRGTPKKYYPFLEGKTLIRRKQIHRYYTPYKNDYQILNKEDTFLEAGRTESLFKGKKIIIQKSTENETYIKFSLMENGYAFDSTVYGLTFNDSNKKWINYVYALLSSKLYSYYQFLTSTNWGIYRPELLKIEHLSFPFIEPNDKALESINKDVEVFIKSIKEDAKFHLDTSPFYNIKALESINNTINKIYGINEYEKDLIDYTLSVSRFQFQSKKQRYLRTIDSNLLLKYVDVFQKEFKNIYKDEFLQVEIYSLNHFIALNFVFLDKKPSKGIIYPKEKKVEKEILKRLANNLSVSQITNTEDPLKNLFIQKDIKGFEKNSFYIIKPNEYKSWHRAMAWYDVAEFKEAIENAEMKKINSKLK